MGKVAQAIQEAVEKSKKNAKTEKPAPAPAVPDPAETETGGAEEKKSGEKVAEKVSETTIPTSTSKTEMAKPAKAEPKVKVKKGRQRLSITVISINPHFGDAKPEEKDEERENIGWEVQVRITAADITTIVFNVERQKQVTETVQEGLQFWT